MMKIPLLAAYLPVYVDCLFNVFNVSEKVLYLFIDGAETEIITT